MTTASLVTTRWKRLSSGSLNRRIFSAAVVVGLLTFAGKIIALGKEVFVASWFGTGDALDAFLIAFLLPSYAINVLAGSIDKALIPVFVEVRERDGADSAQRLFSGALAFSFAILTAATLLLAALGPLLISLLGAGFSPEKRALTTQLFYFLLPGILLSGLTMNCSAALNAGTKFGLVAFAPSLVSMATVAGLAICGAHYGIHAMTGGLVAGIVLQLALVAWALHRRGLSLRPRWPGRGFSSLRSDPALRRVAAQYWPAVAASAVMCSTQLVDQTFAGFLPAGSVAALNYGNKVVALLLGIGTMALGTAVLPYFSRLVADADWPALRHTLRTYIGLILGVTIPLTAGCIVFGQPLVALLYQRGNFTATDTAQVAAIQAMSVLQLPFYTLTILFVRMISALQANHILFWGTVLSFSLNISLDWLLMRPLGAAGIALSTSIVYAVLCLFLGTLLWRRLAKITAA